MGSTTVAIGFLRREFEAIALPDLQEPPEKGDGWVRFTQTAGGRTGLPAPRRVRRRPFIQWQAPLCWSTLKLTLYPDRPPTFEVLGASRFPRHWVYDHEGNLAAKSGLTDFRDWYRKSFGKHTPWGEQDSPALVTAVETALERALSKEMMDRRSKPSFRSLPRGPNPRERGRRGHRRLSGSRRRHAGGERRRTVGRVRARCQFWGSGPASRQADATRPWWRSPPAGSPLSPTQCLIRTSFASWPRATGATPARPDAGAAAPTRATPCGGSGSNGGKGRRPFASRRWLV